SENIFCQLEAIERERDITQYIVHFDMDAFYANVELLENPNLAGKPFGVRSQPTPFSRSSVDIGPQVGRGVLTTASYEARKFGVRSGMPGEMSVIHRTLSANSVK